MIDASKIKIVSNVRLKVTLKHSFKEDQILIYNISNDAVEEIIKLFISPYRFSNPDKSDFYNIIYEDLVNQKYIEVNNYFIHNIELV